MSSPFPAMTARMFTPANPAAFAERQDYRSDEKTITVILEEGPNNWGAYTPDAIGSVIVTAPTREEVMTQFRSALDFHLRGMREDGLPTPDVTELEICETVGA